MIFQNAVDGQGTDSVVPPLSLSDEIDMQSNSLGNWDDVSCLAELATDFNVLPTLSQNPPPLASLIVVTCDRRVGTTRKQKKSSATLQLSQSSQQHEHSNQRSVQQLQTSVRSTQQQSHDQPPSQQQPSTLQSQSASVRAASPDDEILPASGDVRAPSSEHLRMHTPNTSTWIYISGVAYDVTAAAVKEYISKRLDRQNVKCHLLLPRGTSPRTRRSLSFKAKIPSTCTYIALDHSFWPCGVKARYFVAEKDF